MRASQDRLSTSLPGILQRRAAEQPGALAFRFLTDGTRDHAADLTYRELSGRARAVSASLLGHGIDGGRVILALDPGLDYVAALFGILGSGCTAVPSFPPVGRRGVNRFRSIVTDCTPQAVLTDGRFGRHVEEFEARLPAEVPRPRWIFPGADFFAPGGTAGPPPRIADPALLQYSSGSTGDPKGIVLTHAHLISNCEVLARHMGAEPDRVGCSWLPPYHDMGLMGTIMLAVHGGWPLVMMSPLHFVQDPLRWLQAVTDHRVTITVGPNFAFDSCVSGIDDDALAGLDLSSLRQVFCGSEPVSGATLQRFADRFGPVCGFDASSVIPCYGLAEATLFVAGKPLGAAPRTERLGRAALEQGEARPASSGETDTADVVSCGAVAEGHEVLVVDPGTGRPLPPGHIGELWISGPNVATGYLNRPEATRDAFGARPAGAGPGRAYLRSGDLGFLLDGELFVTGRLKDLIIVSGRNLHPQDIEESVQRSHPDVRRTAAFSVPAEHGDEEEVVVVAEYRGTTKEFARQEGALRDRVTAEVTGEHGVRPSVLHFGPPGTVLMTTSGKVRRAATRAAYLAGELRSFSLPAATPRVPLS